MSTQITNTAFDRVQRELGASFMEWESWSWTTDFGDPVGEHLAVRQDVGVWDESPLRKWEFRGKDALKAADYLFTNDMLGLEVGQVRYAPFCDENGKMVGDGTVFKLADDHAWVITALDSDLDHFQQHVGEMRVEISSLTEQLPHLQLQGPRSRELLASLTDADVDGLGYFRFWPKPVEVGGVSCWVSRTGYSGELGYEIFTQPESAEQLWAALTSAGARPYGLSAVETLRIESALLFIGYDYFQHETNPYDVTLDKVIVLDKGAFVGKEALSESAESPRYGLGTVVIAESDLPEYGAAVTKDGEPVGVLTSPCQSPSFGRAIGLAVLDTEAVSWGTMVEVSFGEGTTTATVGEAPLYDYEKHRPRGEPLPQPKPPRRPV